jgi:hypothetical protein
MIAVAYELHRDLLAREDGAGQTGLPMRDRRHPVEEVCGMPGSGIDGRDCRVEVCA